MAPPPPPPPRQLLFPLTRPPRLAPIAEPMPALDIVPPPRPLVLLADASLVGPLAALAARPSLDHALEIVAAALPARPPVLYSRKIGF
ncbi:hypothetical protein FZEAL_6160 [Fusarium zealandicum]|uniref:Uncharacterized protein n=1 Tax=Fusarium zealandicum TaxID=1053134 RepID=A0A8H4UIJ7_9HYPO|nr:hypothetical protein FZEAL_6160 [Fusarium zealandicum]